MIDLKMINKDFKALSKEVEISIEAGKYVDLIYQAFLKVFKSENPDADKDPVILHNLNKLCVRLVFCYYAEDAGVFPKGLFLRYLQQFDAKHARLALIELFNILNTPVALRDPLLAVETPILASFPYVNGGLFGSTSPAASQLPPQRGGQDPSQSERQVMNTGSSRENVSECVMIPAFSPELLETVITTSKEFDWSHISPTLFGALFENTLNPVTRRAGGMHYTSIENIHKLIDPLFYDDLCKELESLRAEFMEKHPHPPEEVLQNIKKFQEKLANLKFLDPACGSGNFLTESYMSLRRLENEALQLMGDQTDNTERLNPIRVSLQQFYGIEINDFAVTVANTAMWIAEAQMLDETEKIIHNPIDFLPLKSYTNIVQGNALRMNWALIGNREQEYDLIERNCKNGHDNAEKTREFIKNTTHCDTNPSSQFPVPYYDYIIGNPPFVGGMMMTREQHADMEHLFGTKTKGLGELDYVSSWFYKAIDLIQSTHTRCAFVSTNSIIQGQQATTLWKPLFEKGAHFDFAYRTFKWDGDSEQKAQVYCVILGFSCTPNKKQKIIFDVEQVKSEELKDQGKRIDIIKPSVVNHINHYIVDAESIFIDSRSAPLCNVPPMLFGSMPRDGGGFILTKQERNELIETEPLAEKWIRPYLGADEFIKGKKRYCLWLLGGTPKDMRCCPTVMKRIECVRQFRSNSKAAATRKFAQTPTLFCQIAQPTKGYYLLVPRVSTDRRKYIPMGFLDSNVIASDAVLIIPDATLYHLGILTSNVHMAWMRAVCGRLGMGYRYSKDIVYNNFVWPVPPVKSCARRIAPQCAPQYDHVAEITETAQGILDARALYPESSLAALYDENTMPRELRKAHEANDKAVMKAYGFNPKMKESQIVAELMKKYAMLVGHREQETGNKP